MKKFFRHIIIFPILIISGCFQGDDPAPFNNFVVEGFIFENEPVDNITIEGLAPIDSDEVNPDPVTDAVVSLSNGESSFPLNFNVETGKYEYNRNDLQVLGGREYVLEITSNGRTATSQTIVPQRPMNLELTDSVLRIPPLSFGFSLAGEVERLFNEERITLTWDSEPNRFYFIIIESRLDELAPILPEEVPQQSLELLASFNTISEPSEATSFEIIGIGLESYGRYVATVFSVNDEYVDLFENSVQDSRDLNEPPSNVNNGLGIFTAFATDSIMFEVRR
ncbi:MAG: DUF4249 family protein [Bacteroidota bacterium]